MWYRYDSSSTNPVSPMCAIKTVGVIRGEAGRGNSTNYDFKIIKLQLLCRANTFY